MPTGCRADLDVLHVISSVAPSQGGPSIAVFGFARHMAAHGLRPTIASTDFALASPPPDDVPLHLFRAPLLGRYGVSPGLARWLAGNAGRYDLVVVHDFHNAAALAAWWAAARHRCPLVVRPCGELDDHRSHRRSLAHRVRSGAVRTIWRNVFGRRIARRAIFHFTTDAEREAATRYLGFPVKGFVCPIGIDLPEQRPGAPGTRELVFLSRLHEVKGLEHLIDAMKLLAARHGDVRLTVAGSGDPDYVRSLRARADPLPTVRFVGFVDGEARTRLLHRSDLFVLPSHHENFGIAAAEAAAHGVPLLLSPMVQTAAELAGAGAAELTSQVPAEIAANVGRLLSDPDRLAAMSRAARRYAECRLAWPGVAGILARHYHAAVEAGDAL